MKALRHAFLPALAALLGLTACQNDIPTSADEEAKNEYAVNWVKTFGLIDPGQDWNMAARVTADIDPSTFGSGYTVNIYNHDPKTGGVLIGQATSPMTLSLDVAKGAAAVFVRAYSPEFTAYMAAEYPIVNGNVDISARSRAEMPLTRADGDSEPDSYQWILACEDLGSVGDYDFNDIVIGVNYVAGTRKLTVTPLAAGGVLQAYVCYGDETLFEIHQPITGEVKTTWQYTMANTKVWGGAGSPSAVKEDVDFSITTNMGDLKIKVVNSASSTFVTETIIEAPQSGEAPQIICVPGDWEWPKETVGVQSAYPGFTEWSKDCASTSWDNVKIDANVVKRGTSSDPGESSGAGAGDVSGHEYVDLGLPSGLLWATCNVGASSPEQFGGYFAWGETAAKSNYSISTSTTYGKTITELKDAGIIDSNNNLTAAYDAATKNWGATWRMPTREECEELENRCTTEWTTQRGVNGRKVTGPNGNSIFLPAAGYKSATSLGLYGEDGHYWSSTAYDITKSAYYLTFDDSDFYLSGQYRYWGLRVRPVTEP